MSKLEITDFEDAAKFVQVASDSFLTSYDLDKTLDRIRRNFYNNAKLYDEQIALFSQITIENIKEFCEKITHGINLDDDIIISAELNVKLSHYTSLFQKEILVNIKSIEDDHISSILNLKLNDMKIDKSMVAGIDSSNVKLSNVSKTDGQIFFSEPLRESILNYCKFLTKIAGCLYIIFARLESLVSNINQAHDEDDNIFYGVICNGAESINKFCSIYLEMYQKYQIDFNAIYYKPNKEYINKWILNVIKKKNKYEDFKNLITKITEKEEKKGKKDLRLKSIGDLLK